VSLPKPEVRHYSRKEFLVVVGSGCPDLVQLASYAKDFHDYRNHSDRVTSLRSLSAVLDDTRARAANLLKDVDAPADLLREYKRTVVRSLTDMAAAAKRMLDEYIVANGETTAFVRAVRRLSTSADTYSSFGERHPLAECHPI